MSKPKIRFKRFTDDWEQRKLGELGEILTGSTPSTSNSAYYSEDGIPWVTPTDINELTISDTPRKLSEEGAKVGRVVPANTILCTCIASIGKNALLTVKGSFNQQINSLTPSAGNDAYFLLTESKLWSNKMKRMAASGTMQIVNKTEFSELDTLVPSTDEQKKIGSYFRNLDHLITLHQRKYNKLVNIKKSMIEKMFPQNGACVPEIRFKGFTDDWEQRKLREVCSEIGDGLHSAPTYDDNGEYYFINGNNLVNGHIEINEVETKRVSSSTFISNDKGLDKNTILLSINGTIGNLAYYADEKVMLGKSAAYLKAEDIKKEFLYTSLQTEMILNNFMLSLTGTTIKNLGLEAIKKTNISIPDYDEQAKIGQYFEQLDNLITLHQRKIEKLKNIKKSCLEKMFV